MSEQNDRNDWSERIERALSGTAVEQVREVVDRLRADLSRVATHDDLTALASRDDLVRGLEAIAATQRAAGPSSLDPAVLEEAVTAQAERILGGFAQRVGQLQTAIAQVEESLVGRIEGLEARISTEPAAPALDVDALAGRIGSSIDDTAASTRSTVETLSSTVEQLAARVEELAARPVVDVSSSVERLAARVEELAARPVVDVSSSVERLAARVEELAARPVVAPAAGDLPDQLLERMHDELRSLEVAVRTEIDAGFRARDEGDTKQVDALALRVTNLSMSVTQGLDTVRAQVQSMQDRAERLEAEQAAILEAIRSEVAGIGGAAPEAPSVNIDEFVRVVIDRVAGLEASLEQRLDALDHGADTGPLDQVLERVRSLDGIEARIRDAVAAAVEPVGAIRAEVREIADQALQLGALPQIESQLGALEQALRTMEGIPERLDALPVLREQLSSLGPLIDAVERVQGDVAAIPTLREQVRALVERPADTERLDAIATAMEPLGGLAARIDAIDRQIASLDARMGGVGDHLGRLDALGAIQERLDSFTEKLGAVEGLDERLSALSRLDGFEQALAQMGARLDELPEVAASTVASRVDAVANELWTIVERLPAAMDERMVALRDRIEQRLEGLHVDLGDVDRLREVVDGMLTTARANEQRLIETATQVDVVATEMREEVGRALSRVAVRLDGIESAVARTILDVRGALEEGARASADAVDGIGGRLGEVNDRMAALDETAASVRAHLQSLPSPKEVADVVTRQVGDALGTFRTATEGRIAGIERDLSGVGTNVNEIWMRARGIAQSLEAMDAAIAEQGGALGDRIAATDARVEQAVTGEQRTAQRIVELEERFVAAARAIEAERDRLFIEAFEAIIERLARDERRLAKRLRGLMGGRSRRQARRSSEQSATDEPDVAAPLAIPGAPTGTPVPDPAPPRPASKGTKTARKTTKPAAKKTAKKKSAASKKPAKAGSAKKVSAVPSDPGAVGKASAAKKRSAAKKSVATKTSVSSSRTTQGSASRTTTKGTKTTKRDATAPQNDAPAPREADAAADPQASN